MLYFIIPLRSASTTRNWEEVQLLLSHTLRSVGNQTNGSFRCVLICHEFPDLVRIPQWCEVIVAPFDAPAVDPGQKIDEAASFVMRTDKGRKQLLGLNVTRQISGSFAMFLDADDLVSNRLSQVVARNPGANGWYFESGYRWNCKTPSFVFGRRKFFHECGSSFIIKSSLAPFPEALDHSKDFSDYFVRRYEVHAYVPDAMRKLGYPLEPLPFHGAIYTFNGQNFFAGGVRPQDSWVRSTARLLLKGKYISKSLRDEFSIPKTL